MLSLCGTEPPDGATLAPELPAYAGPGSCPTIETGASVLNVMQTEHGEREFLVITPSDAQTDELFPVIFLYHWLGGDAVDFYERAEAQAAVDYYRVIAVIPEGRDSSTGVPFRWPFSIADDDAQLDEEFAFHDDMLACVAEQFAVDKECVSSMGVSAGAMFTAMLASRHGDHLSSFISLSGGTGGDFVKPWVPASNRMPALILWGGPADTCLSVDFDANSMTIEADLQADNHFILECVHNCTHATPPFEPEDPSIPTYATAWEFFLDHPYWLEDGESPYTDYVTATGGLPPVHPEWCAIGPGNAQIRQGECGGSEC
jgi:pimeloyl-ACP methyl ester carboxylesterase